MDATNSSASSQAVDAGMRQDMQQGMGLYRTFNDFGPSSIVMIRQSRVIPPVVVDLGELAGLIYRSDKNRPGHSQTYIHFMEDPPRLVSNVEGRQLYIVGGSYRVTRHGIEG
jgi:hypothetical protein